MVINLALFVTRSSFSERGPTSNKNLPGVLQLLQQFEPGKTINESEKSCAANSISMRKKLLAMNFTPAHGEEPTDLSIHPCIHPCIYLFIYTSSLNAVPNLKALGTSQIIGRYTKPAAATFKGGFPWVYGCPGGCWFCWLSSDTNQIHQLSFP